MMIIALAKVRFVTSSLGKFLPTGLGLQRSTGFFTSSKPYVRRSLKKVVRSTKMTDFVYITARLLNRICKVKTMPEASNMSAPASNESCVFNILLVVVVPKDGGRRV